MSRYYRLDGHEAIPCELMEWAQHFKGPRHVGNDTVGDAHVSTVFLGIDHAFFEGGPPLIFETMIFGGPHDGEMWRYSTWDEASAGHAKALEVVK